MRLTCPNCGAQYEVPTEVIPPEGRDVQCSNCGDTWYQNHPDHTSDASEDVDHEPDFESAPDPEPEPEFEAESDAEPDWIADPDPVPDTGPRPQSELDPTVSSILREEAERETRLRAEESDAIESQPDLGLEAHPVDESERRSREARDRMARLRGEEPIADEVLADAGSRRGLLPDIEEINSSLRRTDDTTPAVTPTSVAPSQAKATTKKGGFARGFTVMLVFGAVLAMLYVNATQIGSSIPQAEPMLGAYVGLVDQARVWLDAQVGAMVVPTE